MQLFQTVQRRKAIAPVIPKWILITWYSQPTDVLRAFSAEKHYLLDWWLLSDSLSEKNKPQWFILED